MGRRYKRSRSRRYGGSNNGTAALAALLVLLLLFYLKTVVLIFIILVLAAIAACIIHNYLYKKTSYYKVTGRSYFTIRRDLGFYGEYLTYKHLRHLETQGAKFLFNVYIPKENGETSEIDVLMICPKGLLVFESKNYSGWIFGSENQVNWYQTLPAGRRKSHKEQFYNPVMQNNGHIKHLATFLGNRIPMRSVIVFSDRCTLKNVQLHSRNIFVINRSDVNAAVSDALAQMPNDVLSEQRIAEVYNLLYPFSQMNEAAKIQHIFNIRNKLNGAPAQTEQFCNISTAIQENETLAPVVLTGGAEVVDDVFLVYDQLKDRYPLIMTTTGALNEGFTVDCPILVGKAHGQIIELYEDGGIFVLDVMDEAQTKGTHWHPYDVKSVVHDVAEFMEGKSDYDLYTFKR